MKSKTLAKIAIASALCAPSCAVEHGVVICRDESQDENALYVNLIRKNKSKQKPFFVNADGTFDADRKLFFNDSTYTEPFVYALPGDTIYFDNPSHGSFVEMGWNRLLVHRINNVREREIIKTVQSFKNYQK